MADNMTSLIANLENLLCPPGNGVFTVNTAKARKEKLHLACFGSTDNVEQLWQESLRNLAHGSDALLLGIASDCGGGILRGANWGPLFVRSTLKEHFPDSGYFDLGDVRVIPHLLHDKYLNQATIENCNRALYQTQSGKTPNGQDSRQYPVSPLSITQDVASMIYASFPQKGVFAIGGDHSVSYPLVKAYLQAKKVQGKRAAVIHFDAHTDLLTERLGIDLCFGSWCTHILQDLVDPSLLVQLGIRSSGKPKAYWQDTFGITQHWADEIQTQGVEVITQAIITQLTAHQVDELYVSFDIDAIDEQYAAATGTPEAGGLHPQVALDIIRILGEHFSVTGADMMEVAPFTNSTENAKDAQATTLQVAGEISALLIAQIARP